MQDEHITLPPAPEPHNPKTTLAIALVVSAAFLLAAAGVGIWLLTKPAGTVTVAQQPTGDGSENVKKVTWVAPKELPATYTRRDQNTQSVATSVYFDTDAACGISTDVQSALPDTAPKEVVLQTLKAAQVNGATVTGVSDADDLDIKDEDSKHAYAFTTVHIEQKVAIAGVPYDSQKSVIAFKQFGQSIASISYFCNAAVWDAKKAEIQALVRTFMVKTDE